MSSSGARSDPDAPALVVPAASPDAGTPPEDAWALADRLILAAVEAQVLGEVDHPVRIGKYEVDRPLGAGAMGRILLARDEQLQRRVALKLISPHLTDVPVARERIVREARAMARLSDPHVAQVYEVGEDDGQLFVAMEFVDGQNLRRWLGDHARPWREIVDVFVQAGRGLAAAHDKGLVHRDFKPENVMLEHDGRARVVDFGLARGSGEADGVVDARPEDAPATLTSTGTWLGTPAYMAPEQWDGREVDARSDQFAFCVALYEALAGFRPYAGETGGQVRAALDRGEVAPIPRAQGIPRRIEQAIRRGLLVDPDARWPTMEPLLRALAPRSKVWIMGAVSAIALIGATAIALARADDRCAGAGAPIDEIWNADVQTRTERAVAELDVPWAAPTAAALSQRYGQTADAWRQAAQAVCAADDATADATQCLEYDRTRLRDAIARAQSGDPAALVAAVAHAELLSDPRACLQAIASTWPTTEATDAHESYAEAVRRLGELSTAAGGDHYIASLAAGDTALDTAGAQAEAADDRPLLAHIAWLRGRFALRDGDRERAEAAFREAAERAAATGQTPLRAAANVELVYLVGNGRGRDEEARTLAADAAAMLSGLGDPPVWTARLAAHRASMLVHSLPPQADRAIELHVEATDALQRVLGQAHPDVIVQLNNLGTAYNYAGRLDDAIATLREAFERATAVWGPQHPRTARIEGALGLGYMRHADLPLAEDHLRRALEVGAAAFGEDHGDVASARFNLAVVLRMRGEHEEALTLLRRGLKTREKDRGRDDPGNMEWLVPIGDSELTLGRPDAAREPLQRALDLLERTGGRPDQFAGVRWSLARAWEDDDPAKARVLAEAARRGYADDDEERAGVDALLARLPASARAH